MKLLFDENLSPRLVGRLADLFPGSVHSESILGRGARDAELFSEAATRGLTIVTKDDDFLALSLVLGAPPKVVWIRAGNASTSTVEQLMRESIAALRTFELSATETVFVLVPREASPP